MSPNLTALPIATDPAGHRRGVAIYSASPFITPTFQIRTRSRSYTVAKGSTIIEAETGEYAGETTIAQIKEVDAGKFVKLFSANISTLFGLSPAGHKVFLILFHQVQKRENAGTDKIYLNLRLAQEIIKELQGDKATLAAATFYRGAADLVAAGVIAFSVDQNIVFINPAVLFNGDRARFLMELRKTENPFPKMSQPLPKKGKKSETDPIIKLFAATDDD